MASELNQITGWSLRWRIFLTSHSHLVAAFAAAGRPIRSTSTSRWTYRASLSGSKSSGIVQAATAVLHWLP